MKSQFTVHIRKFIYIVEQYKTLNMSFFYMDPSLKNESLYKHNSIYSLND